MKPIYWVAIAGVGIVAYLLYAKSQSANLAPSGIPTATASELQPAVGPAQGLINAAQTGYSAIQGFVDSSASVFGGSSSDD